VTYSGEHAGARVTVVWNGRCRAHDVDLVGTVPAALSTYAALHALGNGSGGGNGGSNDNNSIDLVISAGTAGGFRARGAAIGDVYVSSAILHHDRRIPIHDAFEAFGLGRVEATATPHLRAALAPALKLGLVSSGNSLDYTDRCMEIMTKHGAHVKEMEAAAVAWVAKDLFAVPAVFALKAVTDIVDGERATADEFLANLGSAAKALQETLPRVIEFCAGRRPSEL
jgi:5'-methylthioadenosine nucleosidase